MNIIGFSLSSINASKEKEFSFKGIETSVEFKDPEKEKVSLLKDTEAISVEFVYTIKYMGGEIKDNKPSEKKGACCNFLNRE